ncbi:hypothetical protein [Sporosarcina sp. NPDC096371]|uniref:hypothetical protein n=1 Tax=Sporosarcina sp. NPDC096371 TaxID=3364530 RepID=UPI003822E902
MTDLRKEEQVIRQFMKNQLNDRQDDNRENDNSFIFLEKATLNRLLNHLLINSGQTTSGESSGSSQGEVIAILEKIIADSKNDFEEMITFLKEEM